METQMEFTAVQAAQKCCQLSHVELTSFTAVQAAQKINTDWDSGDDLFTAVQAAQKGSHIKVKAA